MPEALRAPKSQRPGRPALRAIDESDSIPRVLHAFCLPNYVSASRLPVIASQGGPEGQRASKRGKRQSSQAPADRPQQESRGGAGGLVGNQPNRKVEPVEGPALPLEDAGAATALTTPAPPTDPCVLSTCLHCICSKPLYIEHPRPPKDHISYRRKAAPPAD